MDRFELRGLRELVEGINRISLEMSEAGRAASAAISSMFVYVEDQPGRDPLAVIENPEHREWVRLWNEGLSEREIAEREIAAAGTVGNVISQLRRQHGARVVIRHTRRTS
jgi:hypothetical protein